MAHRIRIQHSGHSFEAIEEETLLEAALRSGLNIRYNCASGTCGECKARLVEGQLAGVDFHDYVLPEAEKLNGTFLMCRAHATSDLLIDASEATDSRDIPRQFIDARITRLELLDEGYLLVQARTPRTQTLRFLAGQYVTLSLPDLPPARLAVASCPCNGMILDFHLRRRPGEPLNDYLFSLPKTPLHAVIDGPGGDFILDDDARRPLFLVAVEEDFAPIKSIIEHVINLDWERPIVLHWVVGVDGTQYLSKFCRAWGGVLEDFRYVPHRVARVDDSATYAPEVLPALQQSLAQMDAPAVYLAGPPVVTAMLASELDVPATVSP